MNELMDELFSRVRALLPPELASRVSWTDDGDDEDGWQVQLILDHEVAGMYIGYVYDFGWEQLAGTHEETWYEPTSIESLAASVAATCKILANQPEGLFPSQVGDVGEQ